MLRRVLIAAAAAAMLVVTFTPDDAFARGGMRAGGYLGGAVATHLRVGAPFLGQTLFPTYVGALLWAGLWLRDATLRSLLPVRRYQRGS